MLLKRTQARLCGGGEDSIELHGKKRMIELKIMWGKRYTQSYELCGGDLI